MKLLGIFKNILMEQDDGVTILKKLSPELAIAAQKVYDEWEQE